MCFVIHDGGIHSAGESRAGKDKEKQNESNLEHADFEVTMGHPNKYSNRGVAK